MGDGSTPLQVLNFTALVLIPKGQNQKTHVDFRPINLCNTIYKIYSKVLSNRLRQVLPQLISTNQCAFLKGRSVAKNGMIRLELIQ